MAGIETRLRAAPDSVARIRTLVAAGGMKFFTGQIKALHGEDGVLESVTIKTAGGV